MTAEGSGRRRAQRLVGIAILLVMVVLIGLLLLRSSDDSLISDVIENLPENVDLGLDRVHYSQNEDGKESWVLDADRATYQRKAEELELIGVELTLFNAGRFGEVKLHADRGVLHQQKKLVDLLGNVRIVTLAGDEYQSQHLLYDYAHKLATTDTQIRMQGRQLTLTGKGMVLDLTKEKLRILEDVRALFDSHPLEGEQQ